MVHEASALAWGLASAASLPAGALIAIIKSPPDKMSANLMSFGGGALLFALSIELFGVTLAHKDHFMIHEFNKVLAAQPSP